MFYTINSSPMLVTKSVFKLTFVLSNYQTCTFPLNTRLSDKHAAPPLRSLQHRQSNIQFGRQAPLWNFTLLSDIWVLGFCFNILTPCTHVTRCDCATLTTVVGNRVFVCNAASPKMRTYWITHSDIAHQYGASKIALMMTSDELGQ